MRSGSGGLAWNGSPLRLRAGSGVDVLEVPLTLGLRYRLGVVGRPELLALASTPKLAREVSGATVGAGSTSLPEGITDTAGDLFEVRTRPAELGGVLRRLGNVAAMSGQTRAGVALTGASVPVLRTIARLEASCLSAPDGARVTIKWCGVSTPTDEPAE